MKIKLKMVITNIYLLLLPKEISKRIEEPRDTLEREHLKDTEKSYCFKRLPDLEKLREIKESKNS